MPRYDLKCDECGTETVRHVPMAERKDVKCSCGATFKVVISPVGFIVRGGTSPNRTGGGK